MNACHLFIKSIMKGTMTRRVFTDQQKQYSTTPCGDVLPWYSGNSMCQDLCVGLGQCRRLQALTAIARAPQNQRLQGRDSKSGRVIARCDQDLFLELKVHGVP